MAREVRVVLGCVILLCTLAWWWLWRLTQMPPAAAGMGHIASTPTDMPMPMTASSDVWSAAYLGPAFAMWAIMMVAMMLPSVSPLILLHAVFTRRSGDTATATLMFAATYLLLWAAFAAAAVIGQAFLVAHGWVAGASIMLGDKTLIAALLALTALYQLSGLKRLCLSHCRSPISFVMRHWRPGVGGAIRMGAAHGLYCLGCCGVLMALLFVGGVMNLAWVALLTLIVLAEKYAPAWLHANAVIAAVLLAAAALLLLLPR
jgi:predicted metal-binding membrane protein